MPDVAPPIFVGYFMFLLIDPIFKVRRAIGSDLADQIRVFDSEADLIGFVGLIGNLQIPIVIDTGCAAAKRLRAVRIGKDIKTVAMSFGYC